MKINAQNFKAAASFASKDKSRPVLTCVRVWDDKDAYRLVSTDSYKLICFEGAESVDPEKAVKLSVKAEHASSLKKSDQFIEFGKVEEAAHLVEVEITTTKGVVRKEFWGLVEGKYPNYQNLLPKVDHTLPFPSFEISPTYLAQASKAVSMAFGDSVSMAIWGQGRLKLVWFEATDDKTRCFGIIMPVRGRLASIGVKAEDPAPKKTPKVETPKKAEVLKDEAVTIAHVEDNGKVTVIAETRKVDLTEKPETPKPPKAPAKPKADKQPAPKVDKPKKQPKPKFESEAVKELDGKFEGVTFTQKRADACVWATGKTSEHKDALKAAGFRWSRKRQAYFRKAA